MSAQGKKKDKSFITLLVLIIVCACLMVAAVTTLGIGMSKGDVGGDPAQSGETTEGTKWSSGSGAPAADSGVTGDFYLDTSTGRIYKKTANGWEIQITIPVASAVTPFINDDGYWQVGDTVYNGTTAAGSLTGALVPQIRDDGYWYINGVKQEQYGRAWHDFSIEDGHMIMDGTVDLGVITPHIGDSDNGEKDGYWYIGETCTGIKASVDFTVENGKLYLDGVPVPSVTAVDGYTPYINEAGNWQIGDKDTGIPAQGQDGKDGATPELGGDGYWYLNGEKIGPATGANGNYWHTGSGRPTFDKTQTEIDGEDTFLVTAEAAEGDFFLNTATGDVYRLVHGEWEKLCSISFRLVGNEWTINGKHTGILSPQWYSKSGDPRINHTRGYYGDYYFDTDTGNIYINVSTGAELGTDLTGSNWEPVMSLATGNWLTGHGAPADALPNVQPLEGNLYLDLESGQMYEYDGKAWQALEGFNLKGGDGIRSSHLFVGTGAPSATKPEGALGGDYYLDTQSGIIYAAAGQEDGSVIWERSTVNRDWISGTVDPVDNDDLAGIKEDGDIYYNTTDNTLWQYSGEYDKWTLLGRLAGATKWFHGSYDPASTDEGNSALFKNLTKAAIEGDYYLRTFSSFSGRGGIAIYVYQGGEWILLADIVTDPTEGYNVPTLDALIEFRDSVAEGKTDYSDKTITLTGVVTMPDTTFAGIGTNDHPFTGTFEGNSAKYSIQNLNSPLFGYIGAGAVVQNLKLYGNLDESSLATFFKAESTHNFNSLLTDTFGLATSIDAGATISNVTLELSNANGKVTVTWNEHGEVTVDVKGNGEGTNYMLKIGSELAKADDTVDNSALLELGKATFTFDHVAFLGRSYLDVTNAKSLTLTNCYAEVAPLTARTRKADGTADASKNDANDVAAFITNKKEGATGSLELVIEGTTILAANSQSIDVGEESKVNANSAAIYLTMGLAKVELTNNTFGAESGRHTETAVYLSAVDSAVELKLSGNAVYGTKNTEKDFAAFVLSGGDTYVAKFNGNSVDVSDVTGGKGAYLLSVVGESSKAQVYLEGDTNTFNTSTDLFHDVKVADAAIDFVAFNAGYGETSSKLTSGYVYVGAEFGEKKNLGSYDLLNNVVEETNTLWIVDIHYEEDVKAFVKHVMPNGTVSTAYDTYYINNVTGLGYFRTSVNGVAAAAGVTAVTAKPYSGKTVILADGTYEGLTDWTSIGTYGDTEAPFSGTFDGNNKTLAGLHAALFGNLDEGAVVKNLTIDGAVVSGDKYVSALASVASGDVTIENVQVINSTITLGEATGDNAVYANSIGVFVGAADGTVTIKGGSVSVSSKEADSNHATPDTTLNNPNALLVCNYGLVGSTTSAATAASVTYAVGENAKHEGSAPSVNVELVNAELDQLAYWGVDEGNITEQTPELTVYTLTTVNGLNNIATIVNGGHNFDGETVFVGKDIDMSTMGDDATWTPIGNETTAFWGTFTGALAESTENCSISGLTDALFGSLDGVVQNLVLNAQALNGKASIATKATNATIENVVVTAYVPDGTGVTLTASKLATAPFGLIGDGSADISSTTLTVGLYPVDGANTLTFDAKIDKDQNVVATFTGNNAQIENEHFILGGFEGATAKYTFDSIKFSGDSYIYVGDAYDGAVDALTVTGCYADVNPSLYTDSANAAKEAKHAAFIVGSAQNNADGSVNTLFTITNNTIISGQADADPDSLAIFTWVGFANGTTITGNTFGSADSEDAEGEAVPGKPYTSAVIKTLGFVPFASSDVTISNNTFYQVYGADTELLEAVDLAPIAVTSDITYNVWFKGNTQIVTADKDVKADKITFVEVHNHLNAAVGEAGQPIYPVHGRVYITDDNTVTLNGKAVTVDYNFVNRSLLNTTFDYVGYGVNGIVLDENGKFDPTNSKITKGNFIFGSGSGLADALNGYVKDGAQEDVHVLLTEGIGNNLSDLLAEDANTYYIYSSVGFKNFMALVNGGTNDFDGYTLKLSKDLSEELGGTTLNLKDFAVEAGEEGNKTYTWSPIGTADHPFKGTFDGTVYGSTDGAKWTVDATEVLFSASDANVGFFGVVEGGTTGGVKNLDFQNFVVDFTKKESADSSLGTAVGLLKSGTLENLTVGAVKFDGKLGTAGALVGTMEDGTVSNVEINDIALTSDGENVGGVIGEMKGGTLLGINVGTKVVAEGDAVNTITGTAAVGGVVGKVSGAVTIGGSTKDADKVNVWSNVTVTATAVTAETQYKIGGIVGSAEVTAPTAKVDGAHFEGKLVRTAAATFTTMDSAYANYGLVGGATTTTENVEITNSDIALIPSDGFKQVTTWGTEANQPKNEYQVLNETGLVYFRSQVSAGTTYEGETVHVMADLDLSTIDDGEWMPIGSTKNPFKGTFTGVYDGEADKEGNKPKLAHKITGLTVKLHKAHDENGLCTKSSDYAGLFGYTDGASINYIEIDGATITAKYYAGALVGRFNGTGTIDHVTVKNSGVRAHHFVGGITGWTDGSITYSTVDGLVAEAIPDVLIDTNTEKKFDNGDDLGGIVGYVGKSETMHKFEHNTVLNATLTAYRDVGGLVGTDNAPTASTYTDNKVDKTTITVSQLLRMAVKKGSEEFYGGYPEVDDYKYVDSSNKPQHADWLVGRFTTTTTIDATNERGDVVINYFVKDKNVGLIYDNGVWHITDVAGFKHFAELVTAGTSDADYKAHFEDAIVSLEVDLELTADTVTALPIKGFAGTFKGNNRTITFAEGAKISGTGNVGIFDTLGDGASVKDLVIVNASVESTGNAAGAGTSGQILASAGVLAGSLAGASVENITVNGATVSCTVGAAGGLFGTIDVATTTTVKKITLNNVTVTGGSTVAALAAFSGSGTLTVDNFTFVGTLNKSEGTNANVVMLEGTGVKFTNSKVMLTDVVANTDANKGFYYGAHADGTGNTLSEAYFIEDGAGLKVFASLLAEKDFAGETVYLLGDITLNDAWTAPTGAFKGTFDGNGFTIEAKAETGYNTLFGEVSGTVDGENVTNAEVKNLTLDGLALASKLDKATIENVYVTIYDSGAKKAYYGLATGATEDVAVKDSSVTVKCSDYDAKFVWDDKGDVKADDVPESTNAFVIKTEAGLNYFAEVVNGGIDFSGETVELTIDIDLTGDAWTPIGRIYKGEGNAIDTENSIAFKGIFNGGGKKITGLTINALATDSTFGYGLFGYVVGGTIEDLTLVGANINLMGENSDKADYVGILAGAVDGTTLTNITITKAEGADAVSTVSAHYYVGAVAGYAKGVKLTKTVDGDTTTYNVTVSGVTVAGTDDVGGVFGLFEGDGAIVAKLTAMSVALNDTKSGMLDDLGAAVGYVTGGTVSIDVDYEGHLEISEDNKYNGMVGTVPDGASVTIAETSKLTLLSANVAKADYVTVVTWTGNVAKTDVAIGSVDGLKHFRTQVKDGNTYEGVTVTVAKGEFDLGEIAPLGADKAFKGNLMGTITGGLSDPTSYDTTITYTLNAADTAANYTVGFLSSLDGGMVANIIFNATINAPKATGVGGVAAKATNSAQINQVTVNANITGGEEVGGIVGNASSATIQHNAVTGTLSVAKYSLGGIAGKVTNDSTVTGNKVGAAAAEEGEADTVVTLTVASEGNTVGGVVGTTDASMSTSITGNTVYASIDATAAKGHWDSVGAILGSGDSVVTMSGNKGEVSITVNENDAVNLPWHNGLAGKSTEDDGSYTGLAADNSFEITWNGILIDEDGWHLDSVADFHLFVSIVKNGNGFAGTTIFLETDITLTVNTAPIAPEQDKPFMGTFNGQGHTIKGFTTEILDVEQASGGLFGYLDGATVENLVIENITVKGYTVVGAVAGTANDSTITGVTVKGTIVLNNDTLSGEIPNPDSYLVGTGSATVTDCMVAPATKA